MKYVEGMVLDREKAEAILNFDSDDELSICPTLSAIALNEDDWEWVQEKALTFLEHKNPEIRAVAAISLGHIARIHGQLDRKRVETALQRYLKDPEMGDSVEEALSDIEIFLTRNRILDRKTAEEMLNLGDVDNICDALLSLAYHDQDWKYVQETALSFLEHPDPKVRRVAARSLGRLSAKGYSLDKDKVISALKKHINDPIIGRNIKESIELIESFMPSDDD